MKFNWKKFGRDLRETREAMGLGLRQCSRDLSIHHATWCRAEMGKPVTVPHYVFLCEWMDSDPLSYAISAPRPR